MLLDEVTSFLDVPRRVAFFALLGELAEQRRYAIVISTHELELALRCANRLTGRTKGGMNTKLHDVADASGRPTSFFMTAGQVTLTAD